MAGAEAAESSAKTPSTACGAGSPALPVSKHFEDQRGGLRAAGDDELGPAGRRDDDVGHRQRLRPTRIVVERDAVLGHQLQLLSVNREVEIPVR